MNHTLNSPKPLKFILQFSSSDVALWKRNPKKWFEAAHAHLRELGLDPSEFEALLWSSLRNHQQHSVESKNYQVYEEFLPIDTAKD